MLKLYGPPPAPIADIIPFGDPPSTTPQAPPKDLTVGKGRKSRRRRKSSRSIIKKKVKPLKLCREIKDYAIRLEKLVAGYGALERIEQEKLDAGYLIAQHLASANSDSEDAPLDDLLDQQASLELAMTAKLNKLVSHANCLMDSVEAQAGRAPLPPPLILQLQRYDDAREAYVGWRVTEAEEEEEEQDLKKIEDTFSQVNSAKKLTPRKGRGWKPSQTLLRSMEDREAGIRKRRRVMEICNMTMTSELRRLCEEEAPETLQHPVFRPVDSRLANLRR
ncbi:uncharacterized protein RCC_08913 [Ramularia collo-cygni]|uniref:Uncharacterized protein n=1 Tax=Ramularia collo-cygni TaxID=112498 RepID=A0A2D3VDQ9_9PEZI|nr:uncharacterized protein RCC_08913 [Ramularia collo-cygni]CZT23202.1 uncharacterized protein RCC_08913 [Ramularia collo-cygni]